MSHFVVIVFGAKTKEDVARALYPFEEQSADEANDPRFEFVDTTADLIADREKVLTNPEYAESLKQYQDHLEKAGLKDDMATFCEWWTGEELVNGGTGHYRNPNAKWDWWEIGGRWTGYFRTNPGDQVNYARPTAENHYNQIEVQDWARGTSVREHREKYGLLWDKANQILKGRTFINWSEFRTKAENKEISWDAARQAYHAQEVVKMFQNGPGLRWENVESFLVPREEYAETVALRQVTPYAFIKDGKWYQKGQMGWFGVSMGEMSERDWQKQFEAALQDPSELLTVVDCHI